MMNPFPKLSRGIRSTVIIVLFGAICFGCVSPVSDDTSDVGASSEALFTVGQSWTFWNTRDGLSPCVNGIRRSDYEYFQRFCRDGGSRRIGCFATRCDGTDEAAVRTTCTTRTTGAAICRLELFGGREIPPRSLVAPTLPFLDPERYGAGNPDLIAAFGSNLAAYVDHYRAFGYGERRCIDCFDGLRYIASYPDLIVHFGANDQAGVSHYVHAGYREGRGPTFDCQAYLARHADLRAAFGSDCRAATVHYIVAGYYEGRSPR